MNKIETSEAPRPIGPYSQAVDAGGVIYCSGQVGLDPRTNALVPGGVEEETRQALRNLEAVLKEAGSSLKAVLRTTVMLKDMADFPRVNGVYAEIFKAAKGDDSPMPARSTFAVAALPAHALVEIDCMALQVLRVRPQGGAPQLSSRPSGQAETSKAAS